MAFVVDVFGIGAFDITAASALCGLAFMTLVVCIVLFAAAVVGVLYRRILLHHRHLQPNL